MEDIVEPSPSASTMVQTPLEKSFEAIASDYEKVEKMMDLCSSELLNDDRLQDFGKACLLALESFGTQLKLRNEDKVIKQVVCVGIGPLVPDGSLLPFLHLAFLKKFLPLLGDPPVSIYCPASNVITGVYYQVNAFHILEEKRDCVKKIKERTLFYVPNQDFGYLDCLLASHYETDELFRMIIIGHNLEKFGKPKKGASGQNSGFPNIKRVLPFTLPFHFTVDHLFGVEEVERIYVFSKSKWDESRILKLFDKLSVTGK